mmetsp:Transcript_23937/g.29108  ORF Transcript_23937/g.29108 Transcript_23937/m.29108 type:complete len:419 (+) Transcript_23937:316-1572(+)
MFKYNPDGSSAYLGIFPSIVDRSPLTFPTVTEIPDHDSLGENSSTRSTYNLLKELEANAVAREEDSNSISTDTVSADSYLNKNGNISLGIYPVINLNISISLHSSGSFVQSTVESLCSDESSTNPLHGHLGSIAINDAQSVMNVGGKEETAEAVAPMILTTPFDPELSQDMVHVNGSKNLGINASYIILGNGGSQDEAAAAVSSILTNLADINVELMKDGMSGSTKSEDDVPVKESSHWHGTTLESKLDIVEEPDDELEDNVVAAMYGNKSIDSENLVEDNDQRNILPNESRSPACEPRLMDQDIQDEAAPFDVMGEVTTVLSPIAETTTPTSKFSDSQHSSVANKVQGEINEFTPMSNCAPTTTDSFAATESSACNVSQSSNIPTTDTMTTSSLERRKLNFSLSKRPLRIRWKHKWI